MPSTCALSHPGKIKSFGNEYGAKINWRQAEFIRQFQLNC
jgi:hypothetical protein